VRPDVKTGTIEVTAPERRAVATDWLSDLLWVDHVEPSHDGRRFS
jgi:hypothetical protein